MATLLITDTDNGIINKEFQYLLGFQPSLGGIVIKNNSLNIFLDSRYHAKSADIHLKEIIRKSGKTEITFSLLKGNLIDALILDCENSNSIKVEDNITLKYWKEIKEKSDLGSKHGSPKPEVIEPYFQEKRISKTKEEVENIKRAIAIIDNVYKEIDQLNQDGELFGMSEKRVRNFILNKIIQFGGEKQSFDAIVAFGKNSAIPHHTAGETTIKNGPLLIDMGAQFNGYCSDFTRMFWIGDIDDESKEYHKVYDSVKKAYNKAFKAAKPGIKAKELDAIARGSISEDGYGDYFTHSTGHGVGLDIHEQPWVNKNSDEVLKEGMVFTIEPGIYLTGKFGVRLENIVFMGKSGAECPSEIEI